MQLRYCQIPGGNFGDDLNLLLWPELFPDIAEHHADVHVYGIGTILGGAQPMGLKVVLGSGSGYRRDAALGEDWRVYWVRGPGTAQRCRVDPALALGDGAVLWSGLRRAHAPVAGRVGLIPHHKSCDSFDWNGVAAPAGLTLIDPRQSPAAVADALASCERVLAESLHGAIFCDTLGVPWRAVALARRFNDFKWRDWLDGLGLPLARSSMHVELQHRLSLTKAFGNALARIGNRGGAAAHHAMRPLRAASADDIARVTLALRQLAAEQSQFLTSAPARREAQRDAMLARCAAFAQDFGLRFNG
jgi:succinoglycan biosynthesis protein ExoV